MLTRHALRLRLYPDEAQAVLLERIAGCCRALYNIAREQRRWFARPGRAIAYRRQAAELGALKAQFPWFEEAPYHCLQQALVDLERAYENFWAGRAGAPKPRKRGQDDSFRFPDPAQIALEGDFLTPDSRRRRAHKRAALKLPKLGRVRCALHRAVPAAARMCSVTVSRDGGAWYASVLLEREIAVPTLRDSAPVVGIDLGVAQPVVLSTGQRIALPQSTAQDLAHEAQLHRRISTKEKGSMNRRKAVARLAAYKARCARRRRDAMEKVTTAIANSHGVVAMEDLRVRAMTASARGTVDEPGRNVAAKSGLNRSLLDVAPGALRACLGQKLAATGGLLLLVPPAHTSQRCNVCGHIEAANRAQRDRFRCVACGHAQDADVNAAVNIRDRARGLWGDAARIEVAASLNLLLAQQAKAKRRFRKKQEHAAGGRPASACPTPAQSRRGKAGSGARRLAQVGRINASDGSSALQGRE